MRASLIVAGVAVLGGCAAEVGFNPANESFGVPSMHNMQVQSAAYRRGEFLVEERARFAAETPETVTFAFDRATLDRASRQALDAQAAWLRANPDVRVRVTGHADLVGGESYNDRLGLRRSRAVARHLLRRGVARGRIDMVTSRGETDPLIPTETRERRNRRAVTTVAGFTHGFVGEGMDGRRAVLMYQRYVSDTVEPPQSLRLSTQSGGGG